MTAPSSPARALFCDTSFFYAALDSRDRDHLLADDWADRPGGDPLREKGRAKMEIPLARPDITEHEIEALVSVLRTPHLSLGPKLAEFEEKMAEYVGVKHAVAVNSGTSALHPIVKALGIGEGDEVITTPFSFIASANCILFERARPVFVDIEPQTLNIDVEKIVGRFAR